MRKLAVFLTLAMLFVAQLYGQTNRTVTGKVTDESGNPLVGVSVTAGTGKTTVTDAKGNYSIQVTDKTLTLKFSSVGFGDVEARLGSRTTVDVNLVSEAKALSEVVVVGYGVQQKKSFTGSASKVGGGEIAGLVSPSADRQLAGRAAGVQVSNPGGDPSTPARIRIRGINSISQSQSPLIVVDGVPFITGNLAANVNSNALGDINPNDIENIEVLKDGSATAIFGSRAANGVIMITTKKGTKDGRLKVNYDGIVGFSSPASRFDLLNADQFVQIANEKRANAGLGAAARPSPTGTNTDWQSVVFNNNAMAVQQNISFSGGTQKSTYFFSLNYSDQRGILISNRNKAYRLRFNFETEVNKYVKFGNNLTLSKQEDYGQNDGTNALSGGLASTMRMLPNVDPFNPAHPTGFNILGPALNSVGFGPNLIGIDDNYTNPAFTLTQNLFVSDKLRAVNNSFLELSIMKGLKFRSTFTFDVLNEYAFSSLSPIHGDGFGAQGSATNTSQNIWRWVFQNYVNYNKSWGSHNLYVTAGQEAQRDQSRFVQASLQQISDPFFIGRNLISGTGGLQFGGGGFGRAGFQSLFARVNYDFASKYFIQASVRRDGQSSLAPENRFGIFPGFSAGWRVSQEKFWDNSKFLREWFSDVKLKTSYAVVGNQLGGFPYLSTFSSAAYGNLPGLAPNLVGNRSLQWEQNKKYDVGVEIGLKGGRYNVGIDWFLNDLDKLVLGVPTPNSAGIPGNSISQNIGTARNNGLEVSVGGDIIRKKDFTWNSSWNHTVLTNKITSLYTIGGAPVTSIPGTYNLLNVNSSLNVLWGLQYAGVNTANGNPMYYNASNQLVQHNIANGAFYFANNLNDPAFGAQTSLGIVDRRYLGLSLPTFFGGWNNSFRYKNFGLEMLIRYSGGNKIMNITRQEALLSQNFHNNGTEILGRWTTPGQVTNVPRIVQGQGNAINQNGLATSRFIEPGDFIRLQNLTVSYTFDNKKLSEKTNGYIKSVRFFVQGQNLAVWTKYSGLDPENASQAGQDNAVTPQLRVISTGLSVGF
jgi:TonB-dependent starch-binding outer membrane protein SusC